MQSWQITLFGYIGAAVLFVGLVNLQLSYMNPKPVVAPTEETQPGILLVMSHGFLTRTSHSGALAR